MSDDPLVRLEPVRDQFARALRDSSGVRPRIEDYLAGWAGDDRRELFRRLLELEVESVRSGDDTLTLDVVAAFRNRFPEYESLVNAAFGLGGGGQPTAAHPTKFGSCRILGPLGQGGMGVVYRGLDEALERPVAVKVMRSELAHDTTARQRFLREALAVALGVVCVAVILTAAVAWFRPFAEGTTLPTNAGLPGPLGYPVVLREHESCVREVAFSPDGRFLASGGDDNTVRLWDVSAWSGPPPAKQP